VKSATAGSILTFTLLTLNVHAEILKETPKETRPDAEFIEFLAEVDEATGDGFEI